jgi:hypothetical protein
MEPELVLLPPDEVPLFGGVESSVSILVPFAFVIDEYAQQE